MAEPRHYKKILVAFDGSPGAAAALRRALGLANGAETEITAVTVDEHTPRFAPGVGEVAEEEPLRDAYFQSMREELAVITGQGAATVALVGLVGHAAHTLVDFGQKGGYDLIVIGRSGHSGLWGSLLGGTTARVVDHAPCDVLVVHWQNGH